MLGPTMVKNCFAALACIPMALGVMAQPAFAQAYPNKPIRMLVGYTPGGAVDAGVRPLSRVLEALLGQPIIIEYKPGAAGGVAMEMIAKMPPDGYTLHYFDSGPLTVAPHLNKVGYQVQGSFTQLGHICGSGSMLAVHPSTPFKSVNDVIAMSRAEPGKWSYGTSGVAGIHHLSGELFKSVTGAQLLHIPYKGGGPAMIDLLGGQVPMLFTSLAPAVGAVKSGKIRPLAVTSPKRSSAFPDVPTMDEVGLKGFDSTAWYGIVGPAGLPADVVARFSAALLKAGQDKTLVDQINATGCETEMLPPAVTIEKIKVDSIKWGKVIKDTNMKAE